MATTSDAGGDEVGVDWPSFRRQLAPPGSRPVASCPPGLLPKDPVRASWPAVKDFAAEKALVGHRREGGGGASTTGRASLCGDVGSSIEQASSLEGAGNAGARRAERRGWRGKD